MAIFVVEHRLSGLGADHLLAVHRALAESARRLSTGRDRIRYVRSLVVPASGVWFCVFDATSRDLVRRVNEVAQVPFSSIDEALAFENRPTTGAQRAKPTGRRGAISGDRGRESRGPGLPPLGRPTPRSEPGR